MKIIMSCFLHLDELPPAMTLIKELTEQGYEIDYYGVDESSERLCSLFNHKVTFHKCAMEMEDQVPNLKVRIKNAIARRAIKLLYRRIAKQMEEAYVSGDVVWVLHEYTLEMLGPTIEKLPFYLTMYELPDDLFLPISALKERMKLAKKIIVPEYTRAAIVQACLGLVEMPYILPNKPYEFPADDYHLEENPIKALAEEAHRAGKKIILYSGIFLRERKLEPFIHAIMNHQDKYELLLIGRWSEYLEELLQNYPAIKYLGFVNPPKHLDMIRYADIGILTYVADAGSINPVFCAPNKTWEYAKFGIPMICNDIPGLKFTVEANRFGYCCDINNVTDIEQKLELICENYEEMTENSYCYYHTVDVSTLVRNILSGEG